MERLFTYIYTSQLSISAPVSCVPDIVRISKIKNKHLGITGLLIFDGDYFCQYLEGTENAVRALIESIKMDKRHTNFKTLFEDYTETSRRFESWSIAYATMEQDSLNRQFLDLVGHQAMNQLDTLLPDLDLQPV